MRRSIRAFTLIEVLVVVIIMTIAARLVIPMVSGNAYQVSLAARAVMDDLLYAQTMAIAQQKPVFVICRPITGGQYPGYDLTYSASPAAISDWVATGDRGPWVTRFGKYGMKSSSASSDWVQQTNSVIRAKLGDTSPGALNRTQLTAVTGAGTPPILCFDALGQPCDSTANALGDSVVLTITDANGGNSRTITVQPITGEMTVN